MPTRRISLVAVSIVGLTSPAYAQGFGGGVMPTTPTSGFNTMAPTPGISVPGANRMDINSTYQTDTSSSTPSDVVTKEPGESPPVTSGTPRQNDVTGKKKKSTADSYSRPQQ